jgi:hypothetical protein
MYAYGKLGIQEMERRKKLSQAVGHKVHEALELYLKGEPHREIVKGLSNEQVTMLLLFIDWCKKKRFKPTAENIEPYEGVHSKKYDYKGTPDAWTTYLVDWKTDSKPTNKHDDKARAKKYQLQLAGYAIAIEEETGQKINSGYTVRVTKPKDDKPSSRQVYYFRSLKKAKVIFKGLCKLDKFLES